MSFIDSLEESIDRTIGQLVTPSRGACGKNLIWQIDYSNDTVIITGTGEMDDYSYNNSAPWDNSWRSRFEVKRVIIDDRVTRIGDYAFHLCHHITEIKLPDSVTSIGENAFSNCERLTEIKIPDGVTSIGERVFYECYRLTSVTIPDSVTTIGKKAFGRCMSLEEIKIPDSVTSIGERAFYECEGLERIYYPAGRGFENNLRDGNNAKLISYTVEEDLSPEVIAALATTIAFIPVVEPASEKLRWKVEGKKLTVGGVREIPAYSYGKLPWVKSVNAIQEIVIEEGVEKISANAFIECTHLELLTIPASVKTIGDLAFTFCYCGDRSVNGGKNVLWSLDNGILLFKKNPAFKSAKNFSTGAISWRAVDKNITGVKLERGITPDKRFFDWLDGLSSDVSVSL